MIADPGLGVGIALGEEAPGGVPQIFKDMDEVDHDGDVDAAGSRLRLDALDLVGVAVDQRDPGPVLAGVAAAASSKTCPMTLAASWVTLATSHLPRAFGPGAGGVARRCGRGRPQRLGSHDDALAVAGEHQHLTGLAQVPRPGRVELVEVDCCPLRELLNLPVAQPLPADLLDRGGRLGERAAGTLDGRQPPQPVGVLLVGQVQRPVSRVQVGVPAGTVGDPPHLDVPEHRGQLALPPRLGAAPRHPTGPDDRSRPGLPPGSQV